MRERRPRISLRSSGLQASSWRATIGARIRAAPWLAMTKKYSHPPDDGSCWRCGLTGPPNLPPLCVRQVLPDPVHWTCRRRLRLPAHRRHPSNASAKFVLCVTSKVLVPALGGAFTSSRTALPAFAFVPAGLAIADAAPAPLSVNPSTPLTCLAASNSPVSIPRLSRLV